LFFSSRRRHTRCYRDWSSDVCSSDLAGVSIFAAAVVFLGLGWHAYSVRNAAAEVRARTDKMDQEFAKYEAQRQELERYFSQKDIASLHDRATFINGIIDARSFNWTQMFMDLEHTLPPGV